MTNQQLADELSRRYQAAPQRDKTLSIHLFAIEFADERESQANDVVARSCLAGTSYATELRKGIKLARHVRLR